jgi:hypothetical protein
MLDVLSPGHRPNGRPVASLEVKGKQRHYRVVPGDAVDSSQVFGDRNSRTQESDVGGEIMVGQVGGVHTQRINGDGLYLGVDQQGRSVFTEKRVVGVVVSSPVVVPAGVNDNDATSEVVAQENVGVDGSISIRVSQANDGGGPDELPQWHLVDGVSRPDEMGGGVDVCSTVRTDVKLHHPKTIFVEGGGVTNGDLGVAREDGHPRHQRVTQVNNLHTPIQPGSPVPHGTVTPFVKRGQHEC